MDMFSYLTLTMNELCVYIVQFFFSPELQMWGCEAQWSSQKQSLLKSIILISYFTDLYIHVSLKPAAKTKIINLLTQSACLPQCFCCLNIIDFTYQ